MKKLSLIIYAVCIVLLIGSCNSVNSTSKGKTHIQESTLLTTNNKSRIYKSAKAAQSKTSTKLYQIPQANKFIDTKVKFLQPVKVYKSIKKETKKPVQEQFSKLNKQEKTASIIRNILLFVFPWLFFLFVIKVIQLKLVNIFIRLLFVPFSLLLYRFFKFYKKQKQNSEYKYEENVENNKETSESNNSYSSRQESQKNNYSYNESLEGEDKKTKSTTCTEKADSAKSYSYKNSDYYRRTKYLYQNCKNPFIILGVNRNSSSEEIRKAYKAAIMKYHPDRFHHYDSDCQVLINDIAKYINLAYTQIRKYRRI